MRRIAFLAYGWLAYLLFLAVYAYLIGFVTGLGVPKTIDGPAVTGGLLLAVLVNGLLLVTFGVQHSVMARPGFKQWWTRIVPEAIERSTYVMISNLLVILLVVCWMPMRATIWQVDARAARCTIWAVGLAGWLLVPGASLLINHFDLFGLRQVWLYFKDEAYTYLPFRTPLLYRIVRHPLYVGWLMAFWATPTMTAGHVMFAGAMTAYILVAIRFEERDLGKVYGEKYEAWRNRTGMLVPRATTVNAEPAVATPCAE